MPSKFSDLSSSALVRPGFDSQMPQISGILGSDSNVKKRMGYWVQ